MAGVLPGSHYERLGVDETASLERIRVAYRRAVQHCHPDRFQGDPQAEALFKELTIAYKVLRDPRARREYDVELGLGNASRHAWYDDRSPPAEAMGGVDADALAGFESIALELASRDATAPRIASRLIAQRCPYQLAWHLAWRAHGQKLSVSLGEHDGHYASQDGEASTVSWQDSRNRHRHSLRRWLDRMTGNAR
ncbi:MAG: DnaJ domain-containing protein [Lautropia sp.]